MIETGLYLGFSLAVLWVTAKLILSAGQRTSIVQLPVQLNGKFCTTVLVHVSSSNDDCVRAALLDPVVVAEIKDKTVITTIVVRHRLINIIIK